MQYVHVHNVPATNNPFVFIANVLTSTLISNLSSNTNVGSNNFRCAVYTRRAWYFVFASKTCASCPNPVKNSFLRSHLIGARILWQRICNVRRDTSRDCNGPRFLLQQRSPCMSGSISQRCINCRTPVMLRCVNVPLIPEADISTLP